MVNQKQTQPSTQKKQNGHKPKLSAKTFYKRVIFSILIAFSLLLVSLGIGMLGYHFIEELPWIDSFLNAAMILSGEGPVAIMQTTNGKLFAGFYALYSGAAFLVSIAVVLAPLLHHFVHQFHLDALGDQGKIK